MRFSIFVTGKHKNRTPFAYPDLRHYIERYFRYAESPDNADIIVFGFCRDIRDEADVLIPLLTRRPDIKLAVVSEEPLWDTLWSGDCTLSINVQTILGTDLPYHVVSHITSNVFNFEYFPYFITTDDNFYVRYAHMFRRNTEIYLSELYSIWEHAHYLQAYYLEKRLWDHSRFTHPALDLSSLSEYRTAVAAQAGSDRVLRVGQGWTHTHLRRTIPDWHLDKLADLDQSTRIVSAMENTHFPNYVTEKIFDAFAVVGIPLYIASPNHAIHRLVPADSFINLYGLTVEEALHRIRTFKLSDAFCGVYIDTQQKLAQHFSHPGRYRDERARLAEALALHFDAHISGSAPATATVSQEAS